jgi:hypothetical protein
MRNKTNDIQSIEDRLRAERPIQKAPDALIDRVMANLPSEAAPTAPRAVAIWPRFALGFASIALIALVSVRSLQQRPEEIAAEQTAPAPATKALQIALPKVETAQLQELTLQLDQPLEKELQNVISDTRQAIQFVASSFLPEK